MSKTLNEKLKYVFVVKEGSAYQIMQNDLTTYLANIGDNYIIGIPFNKQKINEKFVGMQIKTTNLNYGGANINCLCLIASKNIDQDNFLIIAEDFVKTSNRPAICDDPYTWIDKWRTIFGDSLSNKQAFDVLGELISLRECFKNDKTMLWEGPKGGTHDIVGKDRIVEVKTTHLKTSNTVGIHSSYQLSSEKNTNLYFVRLEKKPYCLTINKLVKELIQIGYNEDDLEKSLTKQGYPKGARTRDLSYDLLSLNAYKITKESFPIFSLEDLNKTFAPHNNITGYTLEIDLTGIDHEVVFKKS